MEYPYCIEEAEPVGSELTRTANEEKVTFSSEHHDQAQQAAGHSNPNTLKQFDYFDINIQDVQNQTRSIPSYDSTDSFYSNPGNCNWIDIKFRLKGSSRTVETQVYDGARIYTADEALAAGTRNQNQ